MRYSTVLLGVLLCLLSGCGGGSGSSGPAVSVTLSPTTASLAPAATQPFTATVAHNSNTAVTWSVQEGAAGGSITSAGVYTAPGTAGTYHVVATSQADSTKTAVATVTVHIAVAVLPTTATITLGQSQTFAATVTGTSNTAVTWTVQEGVTGGSITSSGFYIPPSYIPPTTAGTFHVVATSVADPTQQSVVTVVVQSGSASGTIQ
jgi:hypothetical protein